MRFWRTPPELLERIKLELGTDDWFDPCPCPRPAGYNSLHMDWGQVNYVNPPFSDDDSRSGGDKGVGPTAWIRHAIAQQQKGRTSIVVLPVPSYVNLVLEAGGEIKSAGRPRWLEVDTGEPQKSGMPIAMLILRGKQ